MVSGVSGGAVGVGVYAAMLADGVAPEEIAEKGKAVLGEDYISTATTYLLWRDPWVSGFRLCNWRRKAGGSGCGTDRVSAMERRFEDIYAREVLVNGEPSTRLRGPLVTEPLVLFNSTEVGSGRAYVISGADLQIKENHDRAPITLFADRLPMSTAMLVSARFPLVSPDGRMGIRAEGGSSAVLSSDEDAKPVNLIDGGYADNSATVGLQWVMNNNTFSDEVYVLSITNDPFRNIRDEHETPPECPPVADNGGGGNEVLRLASSPLRTLDGARARNSQVERVKLRNMINERVPGGLRWRACGAVRARSTSRSAGPCPRRHRISWTARRSNCWPMDRPSTNGSSGCLH